MEKKYIKLITAILVIFAIGFFFRIGSAYVTGTPFDEKSFSLDENNLPYMYELDSYYNYRLTINYLDHGYLGDIIIDGREWDTHSYSPGVPLDYPPLIVYLTALVYKFLNLFSSVPLLVVCFWISAFVAPLAGVVAYLFTRRLTNESGAFVAGVLTVLAPFYFLRTVAGWFDTDIFIILFPLLVVWLFWESSINKNPRNSIILSALAGFSMFLFSTAWNGWQYYFYLMVVFSILWILGCYLQKKPLKQFITTFLTFIAVTLLLLTLFTGVLSLLKLMYGPLEFLKLTGVQSPWSPWPDIYLSVSELSHPTFDGVVSGVGIALFGGIFGLVWVLRVLLSEDLKKKYLNYMDWFIYLFLVLWALTGFLALIKGSRFIMIMIPPLTISTGIMVGLCVNYLGLLRQNQSSNRVLALFRDKKYLTSFFTLLVILLVLFPAVANVMDSLEMPPGADDNLWDSLEWINHNTSNDTVVFSNWPAGHIITSIANRSVALDGRMAYIETVQYRNLDSAYAYGVKSPTTAREYWIDRAFYTSDGNLSAGIFRMIATSGDLGYLTLDEYTHNTTRTAEILNNILGVDKSVALDLLVNQYNLSLSQAETIISYTHPNSPRPYVVWTYTQMVNKGFWVFNFGSWDFDKNGGENFTYVFADIHHEEGNIVFSDTRFQFDTTHKTVTYKGELPYCFIQSDGTVVNKTYINPNSNLCVVILFDESEVVTMDKRFENSTFTQLVLESVNTPTFRSLYKNNSSTVWQAV
ncbi:STT3 domain-containing protein [Methanobacterium sp. BAmetb5]|uniref:STT3 domain-containing protein n=1 Tax=Methanobacterium sp. BAmetb5 TaxID=2025351 RepID=UPI000E9A20C9|nr:STT3 domain-containing protein [Methanobacterium sp. BAmetb5]AXV41107.1 MAG: peptide transporter [Methanobacterium sp. BAmetb5]